MSDNAKKTNPIVEFFRMITGKKPITASIQDPPAQNFVTAPPVAAAPTYAEKTYKVTGMSHYLPGIMSLARNCDDYNLKKKDLSNSTFANRRVYKYLFYPVKAELVPEPDNPHDPKAIKVLVNGVHVGYIKAGSCAHLLKAIREDRIVKIRCEMYGGPYKYVSEEWDNEKGKFVFSYETGDMPYGITLTITEK